MNIAVTESAAKKVSSLIESNPLERGMRIYVEGGGCSGFKYGFAFESQAEEDDIVIEKSGTVFFIDSMSAQYLQGAEIDYVEELQGSSFQINNPSAKTTCGCGSSFSA